MEEYNKLAEWWRREICSYKDDIPPINDCEFLCMVNGKFMYSNGETYTCDEIIEILKEEKRVRNLRDLVELREMEDWI